MANLRRWATFAVDLPQVNASRDSSDNVILATAVAGDASRIVTGDRRDLLALNEFDGRPIITVKTAVDLLASLAGE